MAERNGDVGVLIVEPHDVYRRALADMVSGSRFRLTAEASNAEEAVHAATSTPPEIILLCLGDASEASIIRVLSSCAPGAVIIATSFHEDGEVLLEALRAGAKGFLSKRASTEEILDALHRAVAGEIVVHPAVEQSGLAWIVEELRQERPVSRESPISALTEREREVVGLLAEGFSAGRIAERLFLSRRTVEGHLANAYRKLGVRSRMDAVKFVLGPQGAA